MALLGRLKTKQEVFKTKLRRAPVAVRRFGFGNAAAANVGLTSDV